MTSSAFFHLLEPERLLPQASDDEDASLMRLALTEAVKGVGRTAPNPPVGAAVATGERVVAGYHHRAGAPHAEVEALSQCPPNTARRALAVTLEPCVHHGKTPPCVDRVLQEGVRHVVVGAVDPNPVVRDKGIARLQREGVSVAMAQGEVGALCEALIRPFRMAIVHQRPYVIVKLALSLDGRVALANGASKYLTGEASRTLVHRLRDAVDGILVGKNTASLDDPQLTTRLPAGRIDGEAVRSPRRFVLDRRLDLSPTQQVFARPLGHVMHEQQAPAECRRAFVEAGVSAIALAELTPAHVLHALWQQHVHTLLVEGGAAVASSFLRARCVDELWLFRAPVLLGNGPTLSALGDWHTPSEAPRWRRVLQQRLGDDDLAVLLAPSP